MRIGFDMHGLTDLMQGSRTYAVNLVEALTAIDRDNAYTLYLPQEVLDAPREAARLQARGNVALRPIPASRFARLVWPFPRGLPGHGLELYHCQYIAPLLCPVPYVLTVHDILHESYPEFFPGRLRRLMSMLYPLSARRAARVLTVSEFSRQELIRLYRLPPERVVCCHNGVGPEFQVLEERAARAVVERYGVEGPFVLFVGRIEPRKNLSGLIQAMERLAGQGAHLPLVVGMKDALFEEHYERTTQGRGSARVIFTGKVPQEDLPAFYNTATLTAYPSFAEGFGLPVLEAMACGSPVVTSNTTSLPEVAGDAALLVDPHDTESLAQAMHRVLTDQDLARRLRHKGLERTALFNWEQSARRTLEVYQEISAELAMAR
jgi:glycosyltransferase involved in cell wall biosynthesis